MRRLLMLFLCLSLLSFVGLAGANTSERPLRSEGATTLSVPPANCPVIYPDGDWPQDNGTQLYVQTIGAQSTPPHYMGPFTNPNPCQKDSTLYGFKHLGWYDNDFGWKHTFVGADLPGDPCFVSASLYICAWDVDQIDCMRDHPNDPGFCEHDRVYGDGTGLVPIFLTGQNYAWAMTQFSVPVESLEDGELDVWLNIDTFADHCNWATMVNHSVLIVNYRMNRPPYEPSGEATQCVTTDSTMCVTVIPQNPPDPDGENVTYNFDWFYFDDVDWVPLDHSDPCLSAANSQVNDIYKVEVTAEDSCGAVSTPWVVIFVVVVTCQENPQVGYDYGDLRPDCYPTSVSGPANPIHQDNLAWLGDEITAEQAPNVVNQDGADDGVDFILRPNEDWWTPCDTACVDITIVTGREYQGEPLYLYGWKDGNLDCDFEDTLCDGNAPEAIIPGVLVVAGTRRFCFPDPGVMEGQGRYDGMFRFRLLSEHLSLDSALISIDPLLGETEDYIEVDLQLPVELLSFTALQDGHSVLLAWVTASELDNDHFIVERRDGTAWQRVSPDIRGAGTSSVRNSYQYRDEMVEIGMSYDYRLVVVDIMGHIEVIGTAGVMVTESDPSLITEYRLYSNYPNPFNPSTTITYDLREAGHISLVVFDVMGREVAVLADGYMVAGRHREVFDAAGL
ncbi:hypothetical protein KKH27_06255, partial [bacterium]|nr:hypothetical protein [bacterium]